MKHLYTVVVMLILSGVPKALVAQKIVTGDSITNSGNQSIPFDEKFTLQIPTKSTRIKGLAYLQHVGKKSFARSLAIRTKWSWLLGYPIHNVPSNTYKVEPIAGKKHIVAKFFDPKRLLAPGKTYTFFWAEDVNDETVELFDLYDSTQTTNSKTAMPTLLRKYKVLAKRIQTQFGTAINYSVSDTVGETVINSYNELKLGDVYKQLHKKEKDFNTRVDKSNLFNNLSNRTFLKILLQAIVKRSTDFDTDLRLKFLPDLPKATRHLNRLIRLNSASLKDLLRGIENIDCDSCSATPVTSYDTRQTNLKTTTYAINELLNVADVLAQPQNSIEPAADWLRGFRTELWQLSKQYDDLLTVRKQIKNKLFNQALGTLQSLNSTSEVYSFETRTKFSVVPDFGVTSTRLTNRFVDDHTNDYPFVPYLGIAVNFRPLNRDVPFKSYKHTVLHRTSLMLGWSLVSIDNGPKLANNTTVDSVGSFFTKGKGTLLVGLGYRIGGVARITTGSMFYFLFPQNADKPGTYDRRQLHAWPFIGLSIDLTFKDLLNGVTDVFSGFRSRSNPSSSSD